MNDSARLVRLSVLLLAVSATATAAALEARLTWHATHTMAEHDLRLRDAVVDDDGNTWVLHTVRDKGAPITAGELALYRLDASGERGRSFAVDRPATHGARQRSARRAFVRLGSAGHPVVAAHTDAGVSVVEVDTIDGGVRGHWLIEGDTEPVAFERSAAGDLTLITAQRAYAIEAAQPPRALTDDASPARLVAAQPVRDRVALVAVQMGADRTPEAHVGWLSPDEDEASRVALAPLVPGATLRHSVSVARGDGLMLLAPLRGAPGSWQIIGIDVHGNLTASGRFDLPPRGKQPLSLDAQPLENGSTLIASARGAAFWLGVLDGDGAVSPVAFADDGGHGRPPAMFALDVRLRATGTPREFMLLGTQAVANAAAQRTDYGVFAARVALSVPGSR